MVAFASAAEIPTARKIEPESAAAPTNEQVARSKRGFVYSTYASPYTVPVATYAAPVAYTYPYAYSYPYYSYPTVYY